MANLHISEFFGLAEGQGFDIVAASAEAHVTDQVVAIGASSVASAAFNPKTIYIRVVAGAACSIALAPSATPPTAVVGGWFLNAGQEAWIRVPPRSQGSGTWEIAVIADTL